MVFLAMEVNAENTEAEPAEPRNKKLEFQCDVCQRKFSIKSEYLRHSTIVHSDHRPFKCAICGKGFKLKGDQNRHLRTHDTSRPYKCVLCGKGFCDSGNLLRHERCVHDKVAAKKYSCDVCDKQFYRADRLRRHEMAHSDERRCERCGRAFFDPIKLIRHKYNVHCDRMGIAGRRKRGRPPKTVKPTEESIKREVEDGSLPELTFDDNQPPPFDEACRVEPKFEDTKFFTDASTDEVGDVDNGIDIGVTSICLDLLSKNLFTDDESAATTREEDVMSRESGESQASGAQTRVCELCGKTFERLELLRKHFAIHDDMTEKPYKCLKCEVSFPRSNNLRHHELRWHEGRREFSVRQQRGIRGAIRLRPPLLSPEEREDKRRSKKERKMPGRERKKLNSGKKKIVGETVSGADFSSVNTSVDGTFNACIDGAFNATVAVSSGRLLDSASIFPASNNDSAENGAGFDVYEEPDSSVGAIIQSCNLRHYEQYWSEGLRAWYGRPADEELPKEQIHPVAEENRTNGADYKSGSLDRSPNDLRIDCSEAGGNSVRNTDILSPPWSETGRANPVSEIEPANNELCGLEDSETKNLCHLCGKGFARASLLRIHVRRHTGERPFQCHECGVAFIDNSKLRIHNRYWHKPRKVSTMINVVGEQVGTTEVDSVVADDPSTILDSSLPTEAPHCEIPQASGFKKYKANGVQPRFACNNCGKGFKLKGDLNRHLRIHLNYRPFKCGQCQAAFSDSGNLLRHKRSVHDEIPRCKCDYCGRTFSRSDLLNNHLIIHEGEEMRRTVKRPKPKKCPLCGKVYSRSNLLTNHMRTHTGEKPFRCDECDIDFYDCNQLRRHERRWHEQQIARQRKTKPRDIARREKMGRVKRKIGRPRKLGLRDGDAADANPGKENRGDPYHVTNRAMVKVEGTMEEFKREIDAIDEELELA